MYLQTDIIRASSVLQPEAVRGASQAGALPRGLLLLLIIIIILLLLLLLIMIITMIIIIIMILIMVNTKDRIAVNMGGEAPTYTIL